MYWWTAVLYKIKSIPSSQGDFILEDQQIILRLCTKTEEDFVAHVGVIGTDGWLKKILIIKILLQSKVNGKYKVEYCGYFRNCRRTHRELL